MSFTAQDLYSIAHEAERVAAIGRRVFDPGLVSFGANVRRLVEEYAYEKSARVAEQADIQTARSEIDQLKSEIARLRNERAASERVTDKHTARKAAELAGSGYKYSGFTPPVPVATFSVRVACAFASDDFFFVVAILVSVEKVIQFRLQVHHHLSKPQVSQRLSLFNLA